MAIPVIFMGAAIIGKIRVVREMRMIGFHGSLYNRGDGFVLS